MLLVANLSLACLYEEKAVNIHEQNRQPCLLLGGTFASGLHPPTFIIVTACKKHMLDIHIPMEYPLLHSPGDVVPLGAYRM